MSKSGTKRTQRSKKTQLEASIETPAEELIETPIEEPTEQRLGDVVEGILENLKFRNCTQVVKTRLFEGTMSYKEIANDARAHFPNAKTTDKSVASIARDMRKEGLIKKREPKRVNPIQLEMFD